MRTAIVAVAVSVAGAGLAHAEEPIRDNSVLVEEAYNQERGVVQHIVSAAREEGGAWTLTLTDEWPLWGIANQLSAGVPLIVADGSLVLGDVAINYRRQVVGGDGGAVAFAPRLTVLLPTGDAADGSGRGGVGLEVNLPLSVELPWSLVAHTNVGATWTPGAEDAAGESASIVEVRLGQSLVVPVWRRLDLVVEGLLARAEEVAPGGGVDASWSLVVNPFLRAAIDLPGGTQIVPALAVGVDLLGEHAVTVTGYLSVEHGLGGS